ncbi:VOC family protein [Blastococcus sp. CT_GayMR19]|uniref:VOC family protein n=1 Tax=Blastococcus sp. CT_GayMR19 TaxID=2559608 RepID=UPI00143074F6|nr:VOC family protein [Blastococcus sp. CT_GayMR19]
MTALEQGPSLPAVRSGDLVGLVQVTIPVTDLARSAAWYRDLLGLQYVREFGDGEGDTGCALADWNARFLVALRLRSTTAGDADLRGEHPIVVEAADASAAARVRARADAMGMRWTEGRHADGSWTEFLDPDGIAVRMVHDAAGPRLFLGVRWTPDGVEFYEHPRSVLPPESMRTRGQATRSQRSALSLGRPSSVRLLRRRRRGRGGASTARRPPS